MCLWLFNVIVLRLASYWNLFVVCLLVVCDWEFLSLVVRVLIWLSCFVIGLLALCCLLVVAGMFLFVSVFNQLFCLAGSWFALSWFVGFLVLLVADCLRWVTLFVGLCLFYLLVENGLVVIVLLASIYCCNFVFIICF